MIGKRAFVLAISLLAVVTWLRAGASAQSAVAGDQILGEWWTENNEGRVRITRHKDGTYRGTTTCCVHDKGDAKNNPIDVNNPNPELRARSTVGIVIIWKLKYEADEYVDGYVYNPRDGKTYRMEMKVIDGETLKIRGYLGISLLGQSQIWKRAHLDRKPGAGAAAR